MTDLAKHQPNYYKKSDVMHAINMALNAEFDRIFEYIAQASRELYIENADAWLETWEKSVGLNSGDSLTTEQRRSRVLSRYRQIDAATPERIKTIVQSYARGDAEVIENHAQYSVTIKFTNRTGKPDNMSGIIEQLSRIMPAHLSVVYVYPYRSWGEVLNTQKTWRDLLSAGYTWRDIMEKEVI